MLLALVVVSGLLYALPAVASAGVWDISPTNATFTATAGTTKLTASGLTVTCTANSTAGAYETATTGKITKLVFTGCTGPLGVKCTGTLNVGEPEGTITATTPVTFHNIRLEASPSTQIGIQITPKAIDNTFTEGLGHFATFKCAGIQTTVAGNGIIGEVTKPTCGGAASTTGTLVFESTSTGVQKWQQITTSGTKYHLWSKTGGGSHLESSEDGTGNIEFGSSVTATCT
ncbi:MAG TPA: hypothetical protein VFP17_03465 [Solirubrobacterales bacterium]|nr:hypothetical protein [Solirubrobacterales bacterium]